MCRSPWPGIFGVVCALLVILSATAIAGDLEMEVSSSSGGTSVPAELVWDGGVQLTLRVITGSFFLANFENAGSFQSGDWSEAVQTQYGFDVFQRTIFPTIPDSSNYDASSIRLLMQPARGFVAKTDMDVNIDFSRYAWAGDAMRGLLRITANTAGGGQVSYEVLYGGNEFDIRRRGACVVLGLRYNVFQPRALPSSITILNYTGGPSSNLWTSTVGSNQTVMTLSLPPQPTFNVSSGQGTSFVFGITSADVYLPISRLDGWTFSLPVTAVDGVPRTYCRLSRTSIVENDLAAGPQIVNVTLQDLAADAFDVTMTNFESILLSTIHLPSDSGINVSIRSYDESSIALRLTAVNSSFDIYRNIYVYVAVPPSLLLSKECGCGGTTIGIAPSAGLVRGNFSNTALTEILINENTTRFRVVIEKDLFVQPESTSHPVFVEFVGNIGTPVADNPTSQTFMQVVASTGILQVGGGGAYADIIFPANTAYNIPQGVREQLRLVIPGSAVASGVTPQLQNVTFEVASVEASFTVTFNGQQQGSVSIRELWNATGNLMVWFTIRGDRWNPAASDRWAYRHPLFYSTFFSAYNTNERPVLDFGKVRIDPNGKIAYVPFLSVINISTPVEERVFVNQVEILTEGLTTTFSSFLVLRTDRASISGNFGGAAEDLVVETPTFVTEDDVRAGLRFNVSLRNQVFQQGNYTFNPRIFLSPASLAPYVSLANGTLDTTGRVMTIALPPLPTYDIYAPDGVGLRVPDSFYASGVTPSLPIDGRINIKNLPGPTCTLKIGSAITEINVRQNHIYFNITANLPFALNVTSQLRTYVTGKSASGGIVVEPVRFVDDYTLELKILKNTTYDIIASDNVTITVTRFMFKVMEGCPGALGFEIGVQPGSVEFNGLPANVSESYLRTNRIEANFTVSNEEVTQRSFTLQIVAQAKRSYRGLYNAFRNVTVRAEQIGASSSFRFTIPSLPDLDVFDVEQFSIVVPTTVLASNRSATYTNNIVGVTPVQETIVILYNSVVDEHVIVEGGLLFQFIADYGSFVNATLIADTLEVSASPGSPLPEPGLLKDIFTAKAFTFSSNGSRMNITLPPYQNFNLLSGNLSVTFYIPAAAMASGLAPVNPIVRFYITSQLPVLLFSGTALYGGSRDLLMSSLVLNVELLNDRFTDMIDSSICPRQLQCAPDLPSDGNGRFLEVQIRSSTEFTSVREVTYYTITFPASAFKNNTAPAVNTVQVVIYPQGGILEQIIDLTSTYEEDVFREGGLPSFTLRVTGDEFVTDTAAIINSLVQGVTCSPSRDVFDFCGRLRYLINRVQLSDSNRAATFILQSDLEFDIYYVQDVVVQITGDAFLSKQAPISRERIAFTVYATAGTVYYSNARTSVTAAEIRDVTSDTPLDVAFTFTLVGERWDPDQIGQIVNGFEANGPFVQNNRKTLFAYPVLSANGRVAVIRMIPNAGIDISMAETITIAIGNSAVLGRLLGAPRLLSSNNRFTITVSGGALALVSPVTYWANDVAARGMSVKVQGSAVWDSLAISSSALQASGVFKSTSSILAEPNGFARYSTYAASTPSSTSMSPIVDGTIGVGDRVLNMLIPAQPAYSLIHEEQIIITLPPVFQQGSNKGPFSPSSLTITVLPMVRELLLLVANPATEDSVSSTIAAMLGIFVNRIDVLDIQAYGDELDAFSRVTIVILDSSTTVEGTASLASSEATLRLYSATKATRQSCCNISAIYWASDPPTKEESDIELGLADPPEYVHRSDDTVWIYVGIGALVVVAFGVIVGWRVYGSMMDSGRNRVRREEPDTNLEPMLVIPKQGPSWGDDEMHEMASRTAYRVLDTTEGNDENGDELSLIRHRREQHRLEGDTDEFTGPTLSLGGRRVERAGHKVTLDVDDNLHAGQPSHLLYEAERLRVNAQPRPAFNPPPIMPMTEDDVVVFPERFRETNSYRRMREQINERRRGRR